MFTSIRLPAKKRGGPTSSVADCIADIEAVEMVILMDDENTNPPVPARDTVVMATDLSRRSFLAAGGLCSLVLLSLAPAWVGCNRRDGRELMEAIRGLYEDPESAGPIARASGWDCERALGVLTREPLVAGDTDLRQRLQERIRQDFVEDRIQLVGQRWLADTEVAIAVVLSEQLR